MGQNRQKYRAAEIIQAISKFKGMVTLAADSLGCTDETVYNYARRYASVADVLKRERNRVTDVAELKLMEAINHGESWAIQFYLKTQGKSRGYVERQELTGADGQDLPAPTLLVYLPSKDPLPEAAHNGHAHD